MAATRRGVTGDRVTVIVRYLIATGPVLIPLPSSAADLPGMMCFLLASTFQCYYCETLILWVSWLKEQGPENQGARKIGVHFTHKACYFERI